MSARESNDRFDLHLRKIHAAANDEIAAATDVAAKLESFKKRAYAAAATTVTCSGENDPPERAALVKATDLLVRLSLDQNTRIPNHTYRDIVRVLTGRFPRRRYLLAVAAAGFAAGLGIVISIVLALGEHQLQIINLGLAGVTVATSLIAVILGARTLSMTIRAQNQTERTRLRCDLAWSSRLPKTLAVSLVWFTAPNHRPAANADTTETGEPSTVDQGADEGNKTQADDDLLTTGRTVTRSRSRRHGKRLAPGRPASSGPNRRNRA